MRRASPRTHLAAALVAAAGLTAAGPAAADTLTATRGKITEKAHVVDLWLRRGHAHLTVVRELHNHGDRHDQAVLHLDMPEGGVATGLRTRAEVGGKPVWFLGELLDAEVAAARYRELTGLGGYYPKDPALLSWRSQSHLALQVFPCPPQADKGVGYEIDLPTAWVEGRERVEVRRMGLEGRPATATLRTDVPGARIFVDGREVPIGATIALDGDRTLELEPPMRKEMVGGRLAAVPFAPERNLVALRFEAPRQIAEVPRFAHVVVALDASRSVGEEELAASMRAAGAHLAHYEGRAARVAVLAFDRGVRDLTKGLVSVDEARRLLDGQPPLRGNGSAIDLALARATQLLAAAPPGAPRRIVLASDLLTRRALPPEKVVRPAGATLHLATVQTGSPDTSRDDDDPWAALPRATGGLLFRATAPADAVVGHPHRADIEAAFTEWARPIRVDHVRWRAAGVDPDVLASAPERLEEGEAIEHRAIQAKLPAAAVLEGELWSRPLLAKVGADPTEGKRWSALVFGTELLGELSEPEMQVLAFAGGAVSPMTSYLAIEPGVRPSTEGLSEGERGGGFGQGIGLGSIGTIGHGAGGGGAPPPDWAGILGGLVAPGVRACGAEGRTAIDAETTYREIVDVVATVSGDDARRTLARCVEEATWAVTLPEAFYEQRLGVHVRR